jgi:Lon protease-like protein
LELSKAELGGPLKWGRPGDNNTMSRLLPLFPLQLVVFPGSAVPLHIFEDRYKEMVGEAEAAGSEFGIVLAKDGGIVNAGCTVVVENVLHRYPDGRFDVLTRGRRRFAIASLNQEREYLRGEVEYFDDEDPAPAPLNLRKLAVQAFEQMKETLSEAKEATPDPDDPLLSFQLAQTVEDLDFQSMVQRSRSEAERLKRFADFIEQYIPRRQYTAKMKRAAPLNGSGHKPASL